MMPSGTTIFLIVLAVIAVELAAELLIAAWMIAPIHGILHLLTLPLQLRGGRDASLQQKNITRATAGAVVLVGCVVLAWHGFPIIGWQVTAAVAAFALLYLLVGICGSQGTRFDVMSVVWPAVLALGCLALLAFIGGWL